LKIAFPDNFRGSYTYAKKNDTHEMKYLHVFELYVYPSRKETFIHHFCLIQSSKPVSVTFSILPLLAQKVRIFFKYNLTIIYIGKTIVQNFYDQNG
jgi:hypothetical protein